MPSSKSKKSSSKSKPKKSKASTKAAPAVQPKAIADKQTKSEILRTIAEEVELSVRQVKDVFNIAGYLAKCHLVKKGSGEFSVPEMGIKIVRKTKPATKKREGRNPITGETIIIGPKPKREVIKVRALKSLKDILN